MWVFFITKTLVNLPQHIYYRILKGNSKIMLLRAWGIISDLIAFSQDLGGGVYCTRRTFSTASFVCFPKHLKKFLTNYCWRQCTYRLRETQKETMSHSASLDTVDVSQDLPQCPIRQSDTLSLFKLHGVLKYNGANNNL